MATTKTPVEFKGELKWVVVPPFSKPQVPFETQPGKENNSHFSLEVECSQQQYNDLIKQGVSRMTVLRSDETTGKTFIRLRAPKVNGTFTAPDPVVKNLGGSIVDVMIANGSEGIVAANIESYDTKAGKRATSLRFHTVVITKLIPYVRKEKTVDDATASVLNNDDAHAGDETGDW